MSDERATFRTKIFAQPWLVYTVVAISIIALGFIISRLLMDSEEDRPPIIVRSGSIRIDNGERGAPHSTWKKWKANGTRRWNPDHGRGANVTGFDVTVTGNATSTSGCSTSFTADRIDVDYSQGTTNPTVTVTYVANPSGKREPQIESSVAMSVVPESTSDPERLEYNPNEGFLSQVRGSSGASPVSTCAFSQSSTTEIRITPRR
jgi:hypothetical protein